MSASFQTPAFASLFLRGNSVNVVFDDSECYGAAGRRQRVMARATGNESRGRVGRKMEGVSGPRAARRAPRGGWVAGRRIGVGRLAARGSSSSAPRIKWRSELAGEPSRDSEELLMCDSNLDPVPRRQELAASWKVQPRVRLIWCVA
ncbi:hypothetical protein E2C01_029093 [Portunus trituberculatus]|uniref:Uncharacterized protein n=1 Tax=Portunus trituberculatus TaxID=210409 RepID=A0A5B7EQK6_PORTR|nr:hypothetical protein [Portunus trituberculatus]